MSDLHRDKRATHNLSVIWKVREDSGNKREAKRAWKLGGRPRGGHPPHLQSQSGFVSQILPLRINKKSLMKVGLIQGLWCFLEGYISKAPSPRRNPNSLERDRTHSIHSEKP
jgi:hypothetical protein